MTTKWPAMIGLVATLVVSSAIPAAAQGPTPASGQAVAAAQEPPEPSPEPGPNPTPPDVRDFQLTPSRYNSNFDNPAPNSFPDRVAKLDSALPRTGVQKLLDQAGRPARFGKDCRSRAFKDMEPPPPAVVLRPGGHRQAGRPGRGMDATGRVLGEPGRPGDVPAPLRLQ